MVRLGLGLMLVSGLRERKPRGAGNGLSTGMISCKENLPARGFWLMTFLKAQPKLKLLSSN